MVELELGLRKEPCDDLLTDNKKPETDLFDNIVLELIENNEQSPLKHLIENDRETAIDDFFGIMEAPLKPLLSNQDHHEELTEIL